MPHLPALPKGYRWVTLTIGGTGMGDERFVLGLEEWQEHTHRRGVWPFRHEHTTRGWVLVEQGNPHDTERLTIMRLRATARRLKHGRTFG